MHAIVAAGGTPQPEEPLFELTQGKNKALLEISGKSMLQWELDALSQSELIQSVIIVGLPESSAFRCRHPLTFLNTNGAMLENIRAGAGIITAQNPKAVYSLLLSADIPAISAPMVDWMIKFVEKNVFDVYYSVVERTVMEKRFPASQRTYVRFKDIEVCGGDLHAIRLEVANRENILWDRILAARKNPFKQAALVGFDILFNLAFKRMTLHDTETNISKKLGISGKAVLCPYAEIGMDVDKPFQFEIMQKDLSKS